MFFAMAVGNAVASTLNLSKLGERGFVVSGLQEGEQFGRTVAGVGDINGDGVPDLVGINQLGQVYVIFGRPNILSVDLSDGMLDGFVIVNGPTSVTASGVARAGDVNDDGMGDLIVGAPGASPTGGNFDRFGAAFVIFGKADTANVDLENLGAQGFRIDGEQHQDSTGFAVAGVGDMNDDGLADVAVGSPDASLDTPQLRGRTHVIFGKKDGATVSLAALGSAGFAINPLDDPSESKRGASLSGGKDVNGDNVPDFVIGNAGFTSGSFSSSNNQSFVVFGKADTTSVELENLGPNGFEIIGVDGASQIVAMIDDVNGDNAPDILVTSVTTSGGFIGATQAFVVFGKPDSASVDVTNLGERGFEVFGDPSSFLGTVIAGGGNANGDAIGDFFVGDSRNSRAHVVYGRAAASDVDVRSLGQSGLTILGCDALRIGTAGDTIGDFNDDGVDDIVLGSPFSGALPNSGSTVVIFGTANAANFLFLDGFEGC